VGCNVLSGNAHWGGVSIGCVLMVAIYALGGISGAHFNPAVSFSLGIAKSLGKPNGAEWSTVLCFMAVQIAGGLMAGACYIGLFWDAFNLAPAKGFGWLEAGLCEFFYTFMLCFVVCNVTATANEYYGLAIGFVIVAGAYGAGAVSGGCFNPAVALGIDTSSAGMGFGWSIVYIFFELLGAALAGALFKFIRPDEGQEATTVQKLVCEFLGTFMLVLTVGLNVLGKSVGGAFSIGASLMCMIYALGDISGGHFNPAVTLACLISGFCSDLSGGQAALYMLVQVIGALCAGFTYAGIYHGESFALGPKAAFGWGEVAIAEIIFTFVLCFVVLGSAVSEKTKTKNLFGFAIGSCVTVGGNAIGGISGGSLNPAVSCGIAGAHLLGGGFFFKAFIYALFEFVGGAIAGGLIRVTHACEFEEPKLMADKDKADC
jgi:aquaporin Z